MYYNGLKPLHVGGHSLNAGPDLATTLLVLGPLFWECHPPPTMGLLSCTFCLRILHLLETIKTIFNIFIFIFSFFQQHPKASDHHGGFWLI